MVVRETLIRRRCFRTPVALECTLAALVLFFYANLLSAASGTRASSSLTWMEDINNATFGVNLVDAAPLFITVADPIACPQFQKIFVVGLSSRTDRRDGVLL